MIYNYKNNKRESERERERERERPVSLSLSVSINITGFHKLIIDLYLSYRYYKVETGPTL